MISIFVLIGCGDHFRFQFPELHPKALYTTECKQFYSFPLQGEDVSVGIWLSALGPNLVNVSQLVFLFCILFHKDHDQACFLFAVMSVSCHEFNLECS